MDKVQRCNIKVCGDARTPLRLQCSIECQFIPQVVIGPEGQQSVGVPLWLERKTQRFEVKHQLSALGKILPDNALHRQVGDARALTFIQTLWYR
ncbi:hypothetical protein D3C77_154590 [compost metagenome]